MPIRRRFNFRRRFRPRRRNNYYKGGLATRPRMMGRGRFFRRWNQVDARVFWFKSNGTFNLNNNEYQYIPYKVQDISSNYNPQGFQECLQLYDQYKVLGMVYRLFPANLQSDPTAGGLQQPPVGNAPIVMLRGNHCVWIDQRLDPNVQVPTSVGDIISTASARLIDPRRPYKVSIWRPKGRPTWGSTKDIGSRPDQWTGVINHFCEGGTRIVGIPPNNEYPVYYWTLQWEVVFRGRVDV